MTKGWYLGLGVKQGLVRVVISDSPTPLSSGHLRSHYSPLSMSKA